MDNTLVPESDFHVCVVGLGYIGLPTAAFIASKGVRVTGVDVNTSYVESVSSGKVPFVEPGFEELLKRVVSEGFLTARTTQVPADAYIVCVPTPFKGSDHEVDTRFIEAAIDEMVTHLEPGALVVLESTSPPGTTRWMADRIVKLRPDLSLDEGQSNSIYVAHCPERVLPGRIMEEMETNDRVIGGLSPRATELASQLYGTFCSAALLQTDATTAEMAKLTENSFRDVNIAFANELSIICDSFGVDVWELIELANHHPRVNILNPGPGVGGHCIAVDPWFIVSSAPDTARLIKQARLVNDTKPAYVLAQVENALQERSGTPVLLLGLAFKADIDDLRESPALAITQQLAERNPSVDFLVCEPNVESLPPSIEGFDNVRLSGLEEGLDNCGTVVVLVDHTELKAIAPETLAGKQIIDTRGILHQN